MAGIKLSMTTENLLEIMDCLEQIKRLATEVNNGALESNFRTLAPLPHFECRELNSRNVDRR